MAVSASNTILIEFVVATIVIISVIGMVIIGVTIPWIILIFNLRRAPSS